MSTIEEFEKRFGTDCIVYGYNGGNAAIQGHWVYVLKCEPHKIMLPQPDGSEVELARPDKVQDRCEWFEVLAKGVRVGKRRLWSKKKRKSKGVPAMTVNALQAGDKVLVPRTHAWGIIHSTHSKHEFLIDESIIIAKHED